MKNLFSIQLLLMLLFMANCRKKEEVIAPPVVVNPPEIVAVPPIKEFSLNTDVKATISTVKFDNGDSQNQIVIVLPETFVGDEISPIIKLTDEAESISPKSGEKVFFEGKPAVEYTLTRKDGKIEKYFLFVQRSGELKAELLTKEIAIDPFEYNTLKVRLTNIGTLAVPNLSNSVMYFQLNPFYTGTKNSFEYYNRVGFEPNSNVFSAEFYTKKTGKVSLKLYTNYPQFRETATLDLSLVRGEKVAIQVFTSLINESLNKIEGVNFDPQKNYTIRLTNDFSSTFFEYPLKYIDDNTLSFIIPEQLANTGYAVLFYENKYYKYYREVTLKGNKEYIVPFQTYFKKVSPLNNYPQPYELNDKLTFKPGGSFIAFERAFSTIKGDLKLINYETKKEFILKGEPSYCCDGSITYRIFTLPETIPVGDYEVYGIIEGETSARYSRKLTIIEK
jgi:hypothetical protein